MKKNIRFIYASSAATYGDGSFGFDDSDDTSLKLKPLNLYAYSKQLFDLWIINSNLSKKVVGLKFFNVFGPNEYHKKDMKSLVCKKFDEIRKTGKIKLFKSYRKDYQDGEQKRDFIYVKDAITIVDYFFKNHKLSGIFNVGTGKARSFNDLGKACFSALGKEKKIVYIDMPEGLREKYQYFTEADISRLQSWYTTPFFSLEEGIADYMKYLQKNLPYDGT